MKNVYSLYHEDGRIHQSNKVFDDEGEYADLLRERELTFIRHGGGSHANPNIHWVYKGDICEMPRMPVTIDRTSIGVGEANGTTLKNVPIDAQLSIFAGETMFFSEKTSGSTIEISAPVPGVYTISITKYPFRRWQTRVIAQ